jgi:hypothetical protein
MVWAHVANVTIRIYALHDTYVDRNVKVLTKSYVGRLIKGSGNLLKPIMCGAAFVFAGAASALASSPLPPGTLFVCDEGTPYIQVLVPHNVNENAILLLESEQIEMAPTPVASSFGADIMLGNSHWMVHGRGAGQLVLMKDDEAPKECYVSHVDDNRGATQNTQAGSSEYVSAMGNFSLGGNVRVGPGIQYDKSDSLPFGEPIALVSRSGVEMDGYEWFEIKYSEGLRGFQWGGILCSNALHIIGIYDCPAELK